MCGIAGAILRPGEDAQYVIERQLDLLDHRGPDARGSFASEGAVIAQNRLSIIDLVTGDPPIVNEDGAVGAVLNGEIYNYRSLRDELHAGGHIVATHGDTEVLVHLAEDLQPAALARRLDGMFAFAVWNRRTSRLMLGRDRLGKKPLFYWHDAGRLVFGSEIKAVLAHPAVPRDLEPRAIDGYLTFGNVPSPYTFYRGIRSVPPGHVLAFDQHAGELTIERYWEPRAPGASDLARRHISFGAAAVEVRCGLERAVQRRLISDVPLGAFLSGGIDSSAIVAIMARLGGAPVRTFTIGFQDDQGFDERPYARLVAQRYGTEHHEFVVRPDAVELVENLLWHYDQPFGDSSAVPTYLLSKLAHEHVSVALAGDGGDELFGGYERFIAALASARLAASPLARRAVLAGAGRVGDRALGGRGARVKRFAGSAALGMPQALRAWVSFVGDADRRALCREPDDWALREYDDLWARSAGAATVDRILDLNLRTYLLDDLLVKTDRMSMAHGLEVRCPLLDIELLDLAMSLPTRHKLRGLTLKRVLRAAVADLLPSEILTRGKRGFGVPLDRWFREDLRTYVRSTLGAPDARVGEHLRRDHVQRLLVEHDRCTRNHGHALWTLLTLEVFLRREGW